MDCRLYCFLRSLVHYDNEEKMFSSVESVISLLKENFENLEVKEFNYYVNEIGVVIQVGYDVYEIGIGIPSLYRNGFYVSYIRLLNCCLDEDIIKILEVGKLCVN